MARTKENWDPKWGKKPDDDFEDEHAMQEHRVFHHTDVELRLHGFKIEHRPKKSQPIWSRNNRQYTQHQAQKIADTEDIVE